MSADEPGRTWSPVDLSPYLDGRHRPPPPTLLRRTDTECLLYPGKVHSLAGEPEAGKTWIAYYCAAQVLEDGGRVLMLDFEDSADTAADRLLSLGAKKAAILERFQYVAPSEPYEEPAQDALDEVLRSGPTLAIVDASTEAMNHLGLEPLDNGDVATFFGALLRPMAASGAAVLVLDHVPKAKDNRGRFAIGAQHKLGAVHVAYTIHALAPFGRGRDGSSRLEVQKDRGGYVRAYAENSRVVATFRLSSVGDRLLARLEPPDPDELESTEEPIMAQERRVLEVLAQHPDGLSQTQVETLTFGGRERVREALGRLVDGRQVELTSGPRNAKVYRLAKEAA